MHTTLCSEPGKDRYLWYELAFFVLKVPTTATPSLTDEIFLYLMCSNFETPNNFENFKFFFRRRICEVLLGAPFRPQCFIDRVW